MRKKKYRIDKSIISTSKMSISTMLSILIIQKFPFIVENIPALLAIPLIAGALSSVWDGIRHALPGFFREKSRLP